ncbi:hypothetical protein [Priestia sp. GS2]|uniref:hypothetical protein n=1 Tax=Priestia sp. GS2 TaxID=3117403 RepID=UPI002ED8AD8F
MTINTKKSTMDLPVIELLTLDDLNNLNARGALLDGKFIMDWYEPFLIECSVYGLFTNSKPRRLEGLVAFEPEEGSLSIYQLEVAFQNRYNNPARENKGIGKKLTAYGCYLSLSEEYYDQTNGALSAHSKKEARNFYSNLGGEELVDNVFYFNASLTKKLCEDILGKGEVIWANSLKCRTPKVHPEGFE